MQLPRPDVPSAQRHSGKRILEAHIYLGPYRCPHPESDRNAIQGHPSHQLQQWQNDLSIYTYLSDVAYQVRAHFEWNEHRPDLAQDRNENKHYAIAKRMLERGGRRDIFLGTRECQGYVEPCTFGEGPGAYDNTPSVPLGLMLHGLTYADETTTGTMQERFWYPVMENGIIHFCRPEECPVVRDIRKQSAKHFILNETLQGCDDLYQEVFSE